MSLRELIISLTLPLLFVAAGQGFSEDLGIPPGPDFSPFINRGIEAKIEDFPYVVSVRRNAVHIGGGAVISSTWAISAAHILLGCPPMQVTLRAGSDERVLGGSLHNANTIVMHSAFQALNLENNIALIGVLEPFIFSETLSAVSLDVQGTTVPQGTIANLPGFGIVMPANQNLSPVLRYTTMTVEAAGSCQASLSNYLVVTSNMLCTMSTAHNPCHGDFGGPLVTNNNVMIGIASWNPFCSNAGYSTVFTRIGATPIRSFIRNVAGV